MIIELIIVMIFAAIAAVLGYYAYKKFIKKEDISLPSLSSESFSK